MSEIFERGPSPIGLLRELCLAVSLLKQGEIQVEMTRGVLIRGLDFIT